MHSIREKKKIIYIINPSDKLQQENDSEPNYSKLIDLNAFTFVRFSIIRKCIDPFGYPSHRMCFVRHFAIIIFNFNFVRYRRDRFENATPVVLRVEPPDVTRSFGRLSRRQIEAHGTSGVRAARRRVPSEIRAGNKYATEAVN